MSKTVAYESVDKDRLKRIQRNRQVQLQRWNFLENENKKKKSNGIDHKITIKTKRIKFNRDIVLLEAISRNDIKEVKELLDEGVDPNSATVDGLTGLHQCAIDDFIEIASLLLKYEANVNSLDSDMWTPLHAAATCNNGHMVILLCKYGADMLALNADGNMPYEICEEPTALNIIENEMSKRGITQQQIDDTRMVPEQKMLQYIKAVIQNKGDLNQFDSQGAAPIHIACSLGYSEVVQILLDAAANLSLPDKDGWLPIHLAACWSHVDIVEYLVVFGADIDVPNASGDTIFDLCESEIRDRLFYIKEYISEIRKNYTVNRLSSNKSFRRSRGTSVRRTSVRQKNMLSKKEAKGEFIALTHAISSPPDNADQSIDANTTNIPSTIDEGSDVDSAEINIQSPIVTIHSRKEEDHSTKMSLLSQTKQSKSQQIAIGPPSLSNSRNPPPSGVTASLELKPVPKSKTDDNHKTEKKPTTDSVQNQIHKMDLKTNSDVDALDKPRYVFSSSTDNWGNAKEPKSSRRQKRCCVL